MKKVNHQKGNQKQSNAPAKGKKRSRSEGEPSPNVEEPASVPHHDSTSQVIGQFHTLLKTVRQAKSEEEKRFAFFRPCFFPFPFFFFFVQNGFAADRRAWWDDEIPRAVAPGIRCFGLRYWRAAKERKA
jgi:hypothetical protein